MAEVKADVSNILEAVNLVEMLGVAVKKALKDGHLGISDLLILQELFKRQAELVAGIDGLDKIPEEVGDLTLDEAKDIILRVVAAISAIRAA